MNMINLDDLDLSGNSLSLKEGDYFKYLLNLKSLLVENN